MIYKIPEQNMTALEKKMAILGAKCAKNGFDFSFEKVGQTTEKVIFKEEIFYSLFYFVDVRGFVKFKGWKLIGELIYTEKGNLINGIDYTEEVPEEFYTSPLRCDHCKTNRTRAKTYVIKNMKSGKFFEVGSSCVKEFTNGLSAEVIADVLSYFMTPAAFTEIHVAPRFRVKRNDFLTITVQVINYWGFHKVSTDGEESTASRAERIYNVLYLGKKDQKTENEISGKKFDSEESRGVVQKALVWLSLQEESSNYFHNLKTVCALDYVPLERLGILVSLISSFGNFVEGEKEKEAELKSEYQGEVGERINFKIDSLRVLSSWETQYGLSFLYHFVDQQRNVYTWISSVVLNPEKEYSEVKGTIKAHQEYKGIKQTLLTRCKVN